MTSVIPSKVGKGRKFIDGEFLYDYYFRVMGTARSQRKLSAVALEHGMVNIFGRAPSDMGCWKAMWRWACEPKNHEKAYKLYNDAMQDFGLYATFEEFKQVLRDHSETSIQFKNDHQRQRYFKRNKLA